MAHICVLEGAAGEIPKKRKCSDTAAPTEPTTKRIRSETAAELQTNSDDEENSDAAYASSVCSDLDSTAFGSSSTRNTSVFSREKKYECPYDGCGKSFTRPVRLAEHLRSHTNERPFLCPHQGCGKSFLRDTHLNHHFKSAHTTERRYECDVEGCGKKFLTGTRLKRHKECHAGREKYMCTNYPPCNEYFRKHATLQRHVEVTHLKQQPFQCRFTDEGTGKTCNRSFQNAARLKTHQGLHHGDLRYRCTLCNESAQAVIGDDNSLLSAQVAFATYSLLQEHIKLVHPPTCNDCQLICRTKKELRIHIEIHHSDQPLDARRKFACDVPGCGKSFTKKANLTVHVQTVHVAAKTFICGETDTTVSPKLLGWTGEDACGLAFVTKGKLFQHIRTVHLGFDSKTTRKSRDVRRATMETTTEGDDVHSLTLLTGEGYGEGIGRHIPCIITACPHRFYRQYDLEVHLHSVHGFADAEIVRWASDSVGGTANGRRPVAVTTDLEDREANLALDQKYGIDPGVGLQNIHNRPTAIQRGYQMYCPANSGFEDGEMPLLGGNLEDLSESTAVALVDAVIDPRLCFTMQRTVR